MDNLPSSQKKAYYVWTGIVLVVLSIPVAFLFRGYIEQAQEGFRRAWEESQKEWKETQQVFTDQKLRLEQQAQTLSNPLKEAVVIPFEKGVSQRKQAAQITAEKVVEELQQN